MIFLVIGAGVIGVSIARELRRRYGSRVLVIEKESLAKMDYVFCCAQFGGIDECKRNELATRAVNVHGMIRVLEALRDTMPVPVYLSSNIVFPGERVDYDESAFLMCASG